jgi:hypothetical protein
MLKPEGSFELNLLRVRNLRKKSTKISHSPNHSIKSFPSIFPSNQTKPVKIADRVNQYKLSVE